MVFDHITLWHTFLDNLQKDTDPEVRQSLNLISTARDKDDLAELELRQRTANGQFGAAIQHKWWMYVSANED